MTRTDILNHLARAHNLDRYLEIGVQNKASNFDKIICPTKIGIDPAPEADADHVVTSDRFFDLWNMRSLFDLIFIDGLHHYDQVKRDFYNADKVLSHKGYIVLHDCNPPDERFTHVPRDSKIWYGDVYRFVSQFSGNRFFYTVDTDCGCAVFQKTQNHAVTGEEITWEYFDKNRARLLNLITPEQFRSLHPLPAET